MSTNNIPTSARDNFPKFGDQMWENQWYLVSIFVLITSRKLRLKLGKLE